MLIKRNILDAIAEKRISLVFRRWKRATVKAGGSLRTAIGVLAIESVERVNENRITTQQAQQAGFATRKELLVELNRRSEGEVYRIALRFAGADPRRQLRQDADLSKDQIADILKRLARMDHRSGQGPWTATTLHLIATQPATLAADLASACGMEKKPFKANVRKLKELGLTESLAVGYRLSPRGKVVFRQL